MNALMILDRLTQKPEHVHLAPSESQVAATGKHTADRGGAGSI